LKKASKPASTEYTNYRKMLRQNIQATANDYNVAIEAPGQLESAYESLLESRDLLFTTTHTEELSEEDTLCNKNLQTSYLFKTLNDKSTQLHKKIEELSENEKSLDESVAKFKSSHLLFTSMCMLHDNESTNVVHTKYVNLAEDYSRIQNNIKKEITTKRLVFEEELEKVNVKLNSIRKLIHMGIEDIVKPEDMSKKMCPVCFEKEVCMVMIPCGHTYCDVCSKYDYRAKCPQCRAVINSRVKMYFSI